MYGRSLKHAVCILAAGTLLGVCQFGPTAPAQTSWLAGPMLAEVAALVRAPDTQWMAFVCAGIYLCTFSLLRCRADGVRFARLDNPDLWRAAMMGLAVLQYALAYRSASANPTALILLAASALGEAAVFLCACDRAVEEQARRVLANGALALLAAGVCFGRADSATFHYRGLARWSGAWSNPNIFGMLMGTGLVLAVGGVIRRIHAMRRHMAGDQIRWARVRRFVELAFYVLSGGLVTTGLVRSYSRGAWIGSAVGLAYLAYQCAWLAGVGFPLRVRDAVVRNRAAATVTLVAVLLLGLWGLAATQKPAARRALSVANPNDFSARNRLAAYEGALQMMAAKPWLGFGWNQTERVYEYSFRAVKLGESAAIQLNDYFTLATTLGLPALACFLAFLGLSLGARGPTSRRDVGFELSAESASGRPHLSAACRAGVLVLLVGFWFDGGLFGLATGTMFWILIELGRKR